MKKIDYSKLKAGYIVGTTMTVHPMAMITKITTAGWRKMLSPDIATHCLAVCCEHDLFYGMEMTWPKIRQIDLNEYEHGRAGNHIVFVAKATQEHGIVVQNRINAFLLKSHEMGIKYDIKGLLEFWNIAEDAKKKLYCSELIREMLKRIDEAYPINWNEKVSPYEVQKFTKSNQIKWWR